MACRNILLPGELDTAFITDFGLARVVAAQDQAYLQESEAAVPLFKYI